MTNFIANMVTVARFNESEEKLWSLAKQMGMRKSLFPRDAGDPELNPTSSFEAFTKEDGNLRKGAKLPIGLAPVFIGLAGANLV